MVITKQIAQDVAKKACAKLQKEVQKEKTAISAYLQGVYLAKIDQKVINLLHDPIAKSFIIKTNYCYVYGTGFTRASFQFIDYVPSHGNGGVTMNLDKNQSDYFVKLLDKFESLELKYKQMVEKIENTLYNLRTFKRVCENMPELEQFFTVSKNQDKLIVPVGSLRKEMKELQLP